MKLTATVLITSALTLTAATQAQELIDQIAPEAAKVVSDANLRTIYTQARSKSLLEEIPFETALSMVSQDLSTEAIRYTVDGSKVRVETDWSCRVLVEDDVWVRITDC